MAYVKFNQTATLAEAKADTNPNKIFFPTDSNSIVLNGKERGKQPTDYQVDYEKAYLTFEAIESGTFKFDKNALQYSLDNGVTWTTLNANTNSPTVAAGSKIMWKQTGLSPSSVYGIGTFSATGNFKVYGNIMSLLYGDNFKGQKSLSGKDYAFLNLFKDSTYLIKAHNLILPAATLADYCYCSMFYGCSSLTTIPKLPATILNQRCYQGMFYGCTALTLVPSDYLPATTLADACYYNMFSMCAIKEAPILPATTLVYSCYNYMFSECLLLKTVICLAIDSATVFGNCISLFLRNTSSCILVIPNNTTLDWENQKGNYYPLPTSTTIVTEEQYEVFHKYELQNQLNTKQDVLVSGTNIKTINNQSLLGSGNINIQGGSGTVTGVKGNSESSYRTGNVNITKTNIGLNSVVNQKQVAVSTQYLSDTEKSTARNNIDVYSTKECRNYFGITRIETEESGIYLVDSNLYVGAVFSNSGNTAIVLPGIDFSDLGLGQVNESEGSISGNFIGLQNGPRSYIQNGDTDSVYVGQSIIPIFITAPTTVQAVYIKCISATGPSSSSRVGKLLATYGSYTTITDAETHDDCLTITPGTFTAKTYGDVAAYYSVFSFDATWPYPGTAICEVGIKYDGMVERCTFTLEED